MNIDEKKKQQEYPDADIGVKFICPSCGKIERDDVAFLCNTCQGSEMINKSGIYMCPTCLKPGNNFECMICDSNEVEMIEK